MFKKLVFIFSIVLLLITGCSSSDMEYSKTESTEDRGYSEEMKVESTESVSFRDGAEQPSDDSIDYNKHDRMVIYEANLSIEVKDYNKVEKELQDRAAKLNGYVVETANYNHGSDFLEGYLTVKIPQESFHSFLNEVESNSVKVNERRISGSDVTEEYVDLESRLKSKQVVEERLLSFMEKAEKTEDLLKISNDLGNVQEEIEQIVGRMKYLQNNVNYSTVTIHLQERLINVSTIQDPEELNTWVKAKSLFMDTTNGLMSFFSGLFVLLVGLSPVFAPLILIVLTVVFILKKKGKKAE